MGSSWGPLVARLKAKSGTVRRDAAVALSYVPAEVLPSLIAFLRESAADLPSGIDDRRGTEAVAAITRSLFPEAAVAGLLGILDDETANQAAKKEAACGLRLLARVAGAAETAVPALVRTLSDPYPKARRDAALALGAFGDQAGEAAGPLLVLLRDRGQDKEVRAAAARALGMINKKGRRVEDALAAVARDEGEDQSVRMQAAAAKAVLRKRTKEMMADLLDKLSNLPDDGLSVERVRAVRMLGPGREAVPALAQALEHPHPVVRAEAALTLIGIGPPSANDTRAIRSLVRALDDEDVHVRQNAAEALWRVGAPASMALEGLVQKLRGDDEALVRETAAFALQQFGREAASAAPALLGAVHDKNRAVRIRAILALKATGAGAGSMLTALTEALSDECVEVCLIALHVLQGLGPAAKVAVPNLCALLEHEDRGVRSGAARTLGAVGVAVGEEAVQRLVRVLDEEEQLNRVRVAASAQSSSRAADSDSEKAMRGHAASALRRILGEERLAERLAERHRNSVQKRAQIDYYAHLIQGLFGEDGGSAPGGDDGGTLSPEEEKKQGERPPAGKPGFAEREGQRRAPGPEYSALRQTMMTERAAFREHVSQYKPALVAEVKARFGAGPHRTVLDKSRISDWVNGELSALGLTFVTSTGRQAVLKVESDTSHAQGVFRLIPEGSTHASVTRAQVFALLEQVRVADASEFVGPDGQPGQRPAKSASSARRQ